jgi:aspartate/methionine/tyrosine aminotransferase
MTGWRCGWLIGPRQLVFHAESIAMCMLFGLPGFIQEAALVALAMAPEAESSIRDFCRRRCELLVHALQDVSGIRLCPPQAGMFMLVDVRGSGHSGREFMRALYESQRVSVMDGGAFGRETEGFVRICFATGEATLIEACRRIRAFLEDGPAVAQERRRGS